MSQRDIADWADLWYAADFTLFQADVVQGPPFEDPEDYKARSPITYIKNVTTPMMFILGEADYRTPPAAGGEADVSRAEVPKDPDRDGALSERVARAVAFGPAVAPHRAPRSTSSAGSING